MLYPLKFNPLFEERIWGGDQLRRKMDKKLPEGKLIGESWELSAVPGNVSVVANGKLAGNSLEELIEVYMGELVGDKIYNKFGLLFPVVDQADRRTGRAFDPGASERQTLHWNAITRTAKPKCGT